MKTCTLSIRQAPEAAQAYLAYVQVGVALAGIYRVTEMCSYLPERESLRGARQSPPYYRSRATH